ncbi:MAG: 2OG-Fe(II) oxygenase family protein [Erythrobacter sp.]
MSIPTAASVDDLARQSVHLRDHDDPEGARALLIAALERYPDEALLWQCLGLAERALLESASAIAALERAAHLAPQDGKIAHALAHVSFEAGLPAVALFDRALALLPADGSVVTGRAAAQFAQGAFSAAVADLAAVCRSSPLWLAGHQALAEIRWQCGDGPASTDSYREALGQHPQSKQLWLGLIDRLLYLEDFAQAQEELHSAHRALGEVEEFLPISAICASEIGDQTAADAHFAVLFTQERYLRSASMLSRGARHLLRTGRPAAAATLLETGVQQPEASTLWPYLATAWRMLEDPRWRWLEDDARLIRRLQIYRPEELPQLAECLRAMHQGTHEPLGQSVRKGSQTDGPLFARIEPPIVDLRHRIEAAVKAYIADLGPIVPGHPTLGHRPRNVRFAGSWSVRLTGAGHHSNHVHPQGWLSSALNVVMPRPAECGAAPAGHLQFGVPPSELGIGLDPFRTAAPEPGWLTLFPSTMWHGTVPIAGGERMTVAFDVRP